MNNDYVNLLQEIKNSPCTIFQIDDYIIISSLHNITKINKIFSIKNKYDMPTIIEVFVNTQKGNDTEYSIKFGLFKYKSNFPIYVSKAGIIIFKDFYKVMEYADRKEISAGECEIVDDLYFAIKDHMYKITRQYNKGNKLIIRKREYEVLSCTPDFIHNRDIIVIRRTDNKRIIRTTYNYWFSDKI